MQNLAYVSVRDAACRSEIVTALDRAGWSVMIEPTGFHVVEAVAGLILGDSPGPRPALIVVDAASAGCSGASIARGLRALGHEVPIVLVADERTRIEEDQDRRVYLADPQIAGLVVGSIARTRPVAVAPIAAQARGIAA